MQDKLSQNIISGNKLGLIERQSEIELWCIENCRIELTGTEYIAFNKAVYRSDLDLFGTLDTKTDIEHDRHRWSAMTRENIRTLLGTCYIFIYGIRMIQNILRSH